MSIPNNITKENILSAIAQIDNEGIPDYAQSVFYDLVFKEKKYPPKLVISLANFYANGEILDRKSFLGGPNTQSFKMLKEKGFEIKRKSEMSDLSLKVWIEKTLVHGRDDRINGDRAMGKVLWSPQKGKPNKKTGTSADIYKNMLLVNSGDLILHFIDDKKIAGISRVKNPAIKTIGLAGSKWAGPSYMVELFDYTELKPPIDRTQLLIKENEFSLEKIANESEVFYNKKLNLREGAYLTPCPYELLSLINDTYRSFSGENLPFIDKLESVIPNTDLFNYLHFNEGLLKSGLQFNEKLVFRFVASLLTKPFVILTGLSGSGKTKLAQAFAKWMSENKNQFCLVPVGADWTNREPLLGYPNGLDIESFVLPDSGALQLILEATKSGNQHKPYFMILDEMNLSHVERYFADFLSIMESNDSIRLYNGTARNCNGQQVPKEIEWPKNLFVIGTVNIDETTYMFSPKVLDRANVIEFRVDENDMSEYLNKPLKPNLAMLHEDADEGKPGLGAGMATDFLRMAGASYISESAKDALNSFFPLLKLAGAEFGYRSAFEISRLIGVLETLSGKKGYNKEDSTDIAIMQKLLPKLHGSRTRLVPVLVSLAKLCLISDKSIKLKEMKEQLFIREYFEKEPSLEVMYPLSFEKILRIYRSAVTNGYASYAEA